MKTILPRYLGFLVKMFEDRGEYYLVASAMTFFDFEAPPALKQSAAMWTMMAKELGKDGALDLGEPKPRGEVLVTGRGYPRGGPKSACSVRVKIGSVDKTLYVVGNRRWRLGAPTEPEPFTEMPIAYSAAFGGAGYAPNPLGLGFAPIKTDAGEVHPLPNIEDPKHLLQSPNERPALPSGFGPYDLTWPQRYGKIGTYDQKWFKERYPGYAADFDLAFFNTAPLDQQIEGYFVGDEAFTLENMHPDKPVIESALPGVKARVFVNKERSGIALAEIPMRAETVHFFPHAERGVLLFRGMIKVATEDASDVVHLIAGIEAFDEPKPITHYETVLSQRLDRKKGHLFALRDGDLLPTAMPNAKRSAEPTEMKKLLATENLVRKNLRRRLEIEVEKARDALRAQGIDPEKHIPAELPADPKKTELEDLGELVENAEAELETQKALAEKRMAEAMEDARKKCAEQGIDFDKLVADQKEKGGGPPKFSATAELQKLLDQLELATRAGARLPHVEAQLSDPNLLAKLRSAEDGLFGMYRSFAHHMYAAGPMSPEDAAAQKKLVAEREEGAGFAGRDFTGADLSGLNLAGVDFQGAFLECANLAGADLRGANLTSAVLARANLTGANLCGAKLVSANLGLANLDHADVSGVDATGIVLGGANLAHATFQGSNLTRADLAKAKFLSTNFKGVVAPSMIFLKSDLTGLDCSGADLRKGVFLESSIQGVSFEKANLSNAIFMKTKGDGAVFRDAILEKMQLVKACSFEGADFKGANLCGALFRDAKLKGSDFTSALVSGGDFSGADLTDAKLQRVVAVGALFMKTDLTRATLRRADLMDAILQQAKLHGTDFEKANLYRADMMKVDVDGATNMKGANMKKMRFVETRK